MIAPTLHRIAVTLSAAALLLLALPAGAASTLALEIDDLDDNGDGTVEVDVDVDVASEPIVIEDATGDSAVPGTDIASAAVELVDDRTAMFRVTFANPLPEVGSTTVPMLFWAFSADGADLQLSAMHNRYTAPGGWSFQLETCEPSTGGSTCTGSTVPGSYADGVVEMEVLLSQLGGLGTEIGMQNDSPGVYTTYGAAGAIWNGVAAFDALAFAPIEIPELEVSATNSATGESASVTPSRGSNIRFDVPGAAGDEISVTATFDGETATASGVAS